MFQKSTNIFKAVLLFGLLPVIGLAQVVIDDNTTWSVFNPANFNFNNTMTIIAAVNVEGIESTDSDVVAAFINGEIRGLDTLRDVSGRYYIALQIASNDLGADTGQDIIFRVWDKGKNVVLPVTDTIPFMPQQVLGSIGNPFILNTINVEIVFDKDDVLCDADDYGWAKANITGGKLPYTLDWAKAGDPGAPLQGDGTDSISRLSQGKYYLSVTDGNGFTKVDSVNIDNLMKPIQAPTIVSGLGDPICQGSDLILFAFNNETEVPRFIRWYNVFGDSIEQGPVLQLPDIQNGTLVQAQSFVRNCTSDTSKLAIAVAEGPSARFSVSSRLVRPNQDVIFLAEDVDNSYQYDWDFGDGNTAQGPNATHAYSTIGFFEAKLTVTTPNGCSDEFTVSIRVEEDFFAIVEVDHVLCRDDNTGRIVSQVINGQPPYTYIWSNGGTESYIDGLTPGAYTLTVTDNLGDQVVVTTTVNAEIDDLPNPVITINDGAPVCFDEDIEIAAVSGIPGVDYFWYDAPVGGKLLHTGSQLTIQNLRENRKVYVETRFKSCTSPDRVEVDLVVIHPNANFVLNPYSARVDGQVQFFAESFLEDYYKWDFGNGGTSEGPNVFEPKQSYKAPGTYFVRLTTTLEGCMATEVRPVQVVPPDEDIVQDLNVLLDIENPQCANDSSGSITVQVLNAETRVTYSWDTESAVGNRAFDLAPGNYRVTVIDGQNRVAVRSVTLFPELGEVAQPDSVIIEDPACFGQDITLTVVNDDPDATFYWYDSEEGGDLLYVGGQIIIEAIDGDRILYVEKRKNGCASVERLRVEVPIKEIDASFSVSDFLIPVNGELQLQANTDDSEYSYLWSYGNGDVDSISGSNAVYAYPQAGEFQLSLTVSLENGCQWTETVTIQVVEKILELEFDITNPVCADDASGVIVVQVKDGVAPFTYLWNTGGTGPVASNLLAGEYQVSVTDAEGNKSIGNVNLISQIEEVPQAEVLVNGGDSFCVGEEILLTAFSAKEGAEYYWYDGQNPDQLKYVGSVLTLQVEEAQSFLVETHYKGCVTNNLTLVTIQGTAPDASFTASADQADIDMNIDFMATTIDPENSYEWDFGDGAIANTALTSHSYSAGGTYQVSLTVTDVNGCQSTTSQFVEINETQTLFAVLSVVNVECQEDNSGSITASAFNGTGPYTYAWSNGGSENSISGLGIGTYLLTITDSDGNTVVDSAEVISEIGLLEAPTVVNSGSDTICIGRTATLYAYTDRTDVTFHWYDQASGGNIVAIGSPLVLEDMTESMTLFAETRGGGCSSPERTAITIEVIDPNSGFTGTPTTAIVGEEVSFTPNELIAGYSYKWQFGDGTISVESSPSKAYEAEGQYTVELITISPQGCVGVEQQENYITVISGTGLTAVLNVTDVTCQGDNDGSIVANVFNAEEPISYNWSNGATTDTVSGLAEGTYTVTIMDGSGLSITRTAEVGSQNTRPEQPTITLNAGSPICAGTNVTLLGLNGSAVDEYRWYDSAGELAFIGSTFVIEDIQEDAIFQLQAINGSCLSEMSSISISVQKPNANFSVAPGTTATVGETLKFNPEVDSHTDYLWQFGDGDVSNIVSLEKSYTASGMYTVSLRVTDADGCTATETKENLINVLSDNSLAFEIVSVEDILCNEDATGSITVRGVGGTAPYTYSWSNDSTGATIDGLVAGIYGFTITDADQSTVSGAAEIQNLGSVIPAAQVNINGGDPACLGTDVFLVAASAGFPDANFEWYSSFNSGTSSSTGNSLILREISGDTTVFVQTNIDGCVSERIGVDIVIQAPDAEFSVTPGTNLMEGDLVQFIPNTLLESNSYDWSFGDNGWSAFPEPYYFYNMPGVYDVTLTVTDVDGCMATLVKTEYINVERMEEPPGFEGGEGGETSPELRANTENDRVRPIPTKVFPNPFVENLSVLFKAEVQGTYTLELTNMLGQVIWLQDIEVNDGLVLERIPAAELNLNNGVYLLQIRNGLYRTNVKVIKSE